MKFSHAYVITGSIGSGKSSVCKIFLEKGYKTVDADKIAHQTLDNMHHELSKIFGDNCVINGHVDRKELGKIVFNNPEMLNKLESLLHPKIKESIMRSASELEELGKVYFIDIPLFFETSNYDFENTVLIYAPESTMMQRLINRDGLDTKSAQNRIGLQMSIEKKRDLSRYIIDNSKDEIHLRKEVDRFLSEIGE